MAFESIFEVKRQSEHFKKKKKKTAAKVRKG